MICGSMSFAKKMEEAKKSLENLGHKVFLPVNINSHLSDPKFVDNLEVNYKHCVKNNTIKKCFDLIAKSDAVLVLNFKKNNTDGYIGTSGLMEIGLAYYLSKKIFLFNKLPDFNKIRWAHEAAMFQPVVINGDFSKIK